jgi:hypothetical protein
MRKSVSILHEGGFRSLTYVQGFSGSLSASHHALERCKRWKPKPNMTTTLVTPGDAPRACRPTAILALRMSVLLRCFW